MSMSNKPPIKTYMLRSRKRYGPILGAIISFLSSFFFFQLGVGLDGVAGKFFSFIMLFFSFIIFIFCVLGFIYLKREKFIGFFISSEGFNDISTGHQYGIVQWKDVIKIRIVDDIDHPGRKYICLKLKNPSEYISRESRQHKRRSLEIKYHYYGSPICFSNRGLDCTFEELECTIRTYYNFFLKRQEE